MNVLRTYSNYSIKFCTTCHDFDCIKVLAKYISDVDLLDYYKDVSDKPGHKNTQGIVRGSVGILCNLCRVYDNFLYLWEKENCVEKLLNFSEKLKDTADNRLCSYMVLGNL